MLQYYNNIEIVYRLSTLANTSNKQFIHKYACVCFRSPPRINKESNY